MGWDLIPWYTLTDDFDADFDVSEWHGTNVFYRDDDGRIFRTYLTDGRGDEALGGLGLPRHHPTRPPGELGGLARGLPTFRRRLVQAPRRVRRIARMRAGFAARTTSFVPNPAPALRRTRSATVPVDVDLVVGPDLVPARTPVDRTEGLHIRPARQLAAAHHAARTDVDAVNVDATAAQRRPRPDPARRPQARPTAPPTGASCGGPAAGVVVHACRTPSRGRASRCVRRPGRHSPSKTCPPSTSAPTSNPPACTPGHVILPGSIDVKRLPWRRRSRGALALRDVRDRDRTDANKKFARRLHAADHLRGVFEEFPWRCALGSALSNAEP